jgi:hypothetical protein
VSTLTLAPPAPSALSRLHVPVTLPPNHRGEPMRHLSYSSISRFRGCPEEFRRTAILGEWGPKTGEMFLGSRVDDAISAYYRHRLDGTTLDLDAVLDLYTELWKRELAHEAARNGPVRFTALNREQTHAQGLKALELALAELIPHIGRPLAIQRRFEFKLHPDLQWSVVGAIDLDTIREQTLYLKDDGSEHPSIREHGHPEPMIALPYQDAPAAWQPPVKRGKETLEPREAIERFGRDSAEHEEAVFVWQAAGDEEAPAPKAPKALPDVNVPVSELTVKAVRREVAGIGDVKVTRRPRYESTVATDLQASIYLGERWLAGDPAFDFRFLQMLMPSKGGRVNMGTSIVPTRRTEADLRATFMRIAQTANQIWAAYRRFGPDEPWGWASEDWRCRRCTYGPNGTAQCPFALRGTAN